MVLHKTTQYGSTTVNSYSIGKLIEFKLISNYPSLSKRYALVLMDNFRLVIDKYTVNLILLRPFKNIYLLKLRSFNNQNLSNSLRE
jgi:hypothetical protein